MSLPALAPAVTPAPGPAVPVSAASEVAPAPASPVVLTGETLYQRALADLGQVTPQPPALDPSNGPLPGSPAASPDPSSPPAGAAPAPAGDDDDAGENNDDDDANAGNLPAGIRQTLSALRAERRELREQLAAAQAEAKAGTVPKPAETPPPSPTTPTPVQRVQKFAEGLAWANRQLTAVRKGDLESALGAIRQVEAQPPGNDAESLTEWLEAVRDAYQENLTEAKLDQRLEQQTQAAQAAGMRASAHAQARAVMPELAQPESVRAQRAAQLLKVHPWLADDPRGDIALVAIIRGLEAMQLEAANPAGQPGGHGGNGNGGNGNGKLAPRVVLPARASGRLPGAPSGAPSGPPGGATSKALFNRYQESGKEEDKTAWKDAVARDLSGAPAPG